MKCYRVEQKEVLIFMFKVRICGCRNFFDYNLLKEKCLFYLKDKLPDVVIYSGGGNGADSLGERFAKEMGLELVIYKPDWDADGKSAGPKNNEKIVREVDAAICFWDGKSKGTKHTIDFCKMYDKPCRIVKI